MYKARLSVAALLALSAGCAQQSPHEDSEATSVREERYEPGSDAAPGVDVTAAPGVAFNYRYAFRLPGNRISAVQEAHAQACERLGLAKCRITGMRYRLVNQKDIEAMLALRLDPALARNFGKQATQLVEKADGMLVDQEITGEDVGTRIAGANRSEAQLRQELARVEAELARAVPMVRGNVAPQAAVDRQNLLNQAAELRRQIASLSESKQADEEALSGTPMSFNYGSGSVVPGFDVRSPLREALERARDNFLGGFSAILVILISLVPWALLAAALIWIWRRLRHRLGWNALGYRDPIAADAGPSLAVDDASPARPGRRKPAADV
jgi:hypothetical protein